MRLGVHAFTWVSTWSGETAPVAIRRTAEAGFSFVEIPLLRPDEVDPNWVRDLLRGHGLEATCSLVLPAEASFPYAPQAATRFLLRAAEVAHRLGSSVLTGVVYGSPDRFPPSSPRPEDLDLIASCLRQVARAMAGEGMKLGIEPVNRYETSLVNTADQGLALIAAIGEPNVFLHLDTYHMNIEEQGFSGPIQRAGRALQYVHLSESHRGEPGTGNVRWDEVMAGLAAVGFGGYLALEVFTTRSEELGRVTNIWRVGGDDPRHVAARGREFLSDLARVHGLASQSGP